MCFFLITGHPISFFSLMHKKSLRKIKLPESCVVHCGIYKKRKRAFSKKYSGHLEYRKRSPSTRDIVYFSVIIVITIGIQNNAMYSCT